jgi:hypothetical protein
MTKFFAIVGPATFVVLLAGWASAQTLTIPPNVECKVVSTKISVDSKGRTIIVEKKVCTSR